MILADKPLFQEFHLDGVKYISPEEALKLIEKDEIFFIDVREEEEIIKEYLDFQNVFFHPMSVILDRLSYIPKNIPIVVVCSDGIRSTKVANLLNRNEFPEVASLDGGLVVWKEKGFRIVTNESGACDTDSCGCGCSCCG